MVVHLCDVHFALGCLDMQAWFDRHQACVSAAPYINRFRSMQRGVERRTMLSALRKQWHQARFFNLLY